MAKLYMGVDGGQSGTAAVLADGDGNILGVGAGDPCGFVYERDGKEKLKSVIRSVVAATFRAAGLPPGRLHALGVGLTGGFEYFHDIAAGAADFEYVSCEWDAVTALIGGNGTRSGIVVIGGTGSTALGMLDNGGMVRCGGWGYAIGDEGSAYDIGIRALRAASQSVDGRSEHTRLPEAMIGSLGLNRMLEVKMLLMRGELPRERIASLARLVDGCAREGDLVSRRLLLDAADALAAHVRSLIGKGGVSSSSRVCVVGGVFRSETVFARFCEQISRMYPQADVVKPLFPPTIGALLLAFEAASLPTDRAIVNNLLRGTAQFLPGLKA